MSVTLENRSRRMLVFVLDHETYCSARKECVCGDSGPRKPRIPNSLTLPAAARAEGLDDAVLAVPDVQRAVRRSDIAATQEPPNAHDASAAAPTDESPATNPASTEARVGDQREPRATPRKKRGNS